MRISDWSSDVCSSDLSSRLIGKAHFDPTLFAKVSALTAQGRFLDAQALQVNAPGGFSVNGDDGNLNFGNAGDILDRKSVVSGTSVSVRVDLGGRRIIKKKNQKE